MPSASAPGRVLPYAGYKPAPEQEGNTAMNLNKLLTALRQRKNTPARNQQAGRHERYTHALEQFLDGHQPAVRLGGVYTLVNLADEWLTDDSLPEQVRREEAQTIVDTLTGCIRTPYPLAQNRQILEADEAPEGYEGDFTRDQEALREEQLVRRTVFTEFSRRLATVAASNKTGNEEDQHAVPSVSPTWADLRFDFSGAPIFYPLRQLHFQNADFASATFYGPADFSGATFHGDTSFSAAQFTADASFHGANFTDWVGFSGARFADAASFATVTFTGETDFSDAVFSAAADFAVSAFKSDANFSRLNTAGIASFAAVTFDGKAVFTASTFHDEAHFAASVFNRPAVFSKSLFGGVARFAGVVTKQSAMFSNVRFASAADFSGASFTQYEDFGGARFDGDATFSRASFIALPRTRYEMDFPQGANFGNATFAQDADFSMATFTAHVGFYKATFAREVSFNGASFEGAYFADATFSQRADFRQTSFACVEPSFGGSKSQQQRARFSAQADPQDYLFEARPESPHGFSCGEAELLNRTFILPLGAVLYDPASWDEEKQDYTRISEPAQ